MTEIPKDFPWRAGMLMVDVTGSLAPVRCVAGNEGVRVYGRAVLFRPARDAEDSLDWPEWAPDLTDAATLGALEGAVAEAHDEPTLHARPVHVDAYESAEPTVVWHIERAAEDDHEWLRHSGVWGAVEDGHQDPPIVARSKSEALIAAWNARPVPK